MFVDHMLNETDIFEGAQNVKTSDILGDKTTAPSIPTSYYIIFIITIICWTVLNNFLAQALKQAHNCTRQADSDEKSLHTYKTIV